MRNSEIEKIQVKDIITIDNYHFIDISKSKTKNGIRIVPLHDFVYQKISAYIKKNRIEGYIFTKAGKATGSRPYNTANSKLSKFTGYSKEMLEKENITFYSGRHFWKTLMDSENLGDIEEYFMGHKVSGDVAKRYNHKDKQGKKKLLEKTRKVFQILDKYVFT
jgi:integrase